MTPLKSNWDKIVTTIVVFLKNKIDLKKIGDNWMLVFILSFFKNPYLVYY